jgi:hypothetical protein
MEHALRRRFPFAGDQVRGGVSGHQLGGPAHHRGGHLRVGAGALDVDARQDEDVPGVHAAASRTGHQSVGPLADDDGGASPAAIAQKTQFQMPSTIPARQTHRKELPVAFRRLLVDGSDVRHRHAGA